MLTNGKEHKMDQRRIQAMATGVLFLLGTGFGVAAAVAAASFLNTPAYLTVMADQKTAVLSAALLILLMGLSCAGIGMSLYPVLKRHGDGIAMGVAGFRLMEGTIQAASAVALMVLLAVSEEFVKAGSPSGSFFPSLGAVVKATNDWINDGVYLLPWGAAALLYYAVFYRFRLVPRWLSAWGLAGIVLMLVSAIGTLTDLWPSGSSVQALLIGPVALQELVLAVWLIARGYEE